MDRLAELRERRALTLRELSEMSGVAADTINQIELGHRRARPSTLRKLARALEVDVEEFYAEPTLAGKAEAPREAGPDQLHSAVGLEGERRGKEALGQALTEIVQWWLQTGPPTSRFEAGEHFGFMDSAFELQRVLNAWLEPRVGSVEKAHNLSTAELLAIGPVQHTAGLLSQVIDQKLRQLREYAEREDKPALLDELEQRRRKRAEQQAILEKRTRSTG